ncbi:MBL fold metallo-hydrolase [Natronolimnohabitans innermongolicus]|uniref:Beta-lactamase domain protein n=1 Tax=Natronolimnohabitans innermongolicus JCM 12255 TaxID=1227499 RepID=L9XH01_9EURY|nr:MBL fold metallo-hydrolase [Natronolimnohabitans innermongolicus]ELY59958.1 beta-lactamase domain protein [Natronolimnohabitans innermongolicus JCM 12255]
MNTDTGGRTRGARPFSTLHRLEFDVPWPPKHVAAYLLDGPEPILVDAGRPTDDARATLEDELERFDISVSDIEHVLVTHPHSDHLGQAATLREAGATIHASGPALERLRTPVEAFRENVEETARVMGYRGEQYADVVDAEVDSFRRDRRLLDPDATEPITPGSSVSVGGREFAAIETPGHQIHHLSFETELAGTTALFAGDALIEPFRAGAFHVGIARGADEGIDRYYDAMDRLGETAATHVFPGHGPTFEDPQRVVRRTRDRLGTLLEETVDALAALEPATTLEIAEERAGTVRYTAPVMDTFGALGTLERRGRVRSDVDEGVRYYRTATATHDASD